MARSVRAKVLAVAVVAMALAVGLGIWLTTGDDTEPGLSHVEYVRLYELAAFGQKQADVLAQWPKKRYQTYHDGTGSQCFEWLEEYDGGKHHALYDMCFKKGRLVNKFHP